MEIVDLKLHYPNLNIKAQIHQIRKYSHNLLPELKQWKGQQFLGFFMLDDYFFCITWWTLEIFSMKMQDIKYLVYNECQLFQILQDNFNDEFDDLMTFDDFTTRNDRWEKDKYSSFREVFEMFNKQCARNYSPDDFFRHR